VSASRELISNITDVVTDEIEIWRNRPVDEVYPIVYIDGIRIKVRDKAAVTTKVAHLVIASMSTAASTPWVAGSPRPKARGSGTRS
jgi:transposase-like protein